MPDSVHSLCRRLIDDYCSAGHRHHLQGELAGYKLTGFPVGCEPGKASAELIAASRVMLGQMLDAKPTHTTAVVSAVIFQCAVFCNG